MRHKLISFFLIICMLAMMPMTSFAQKADPERLGSISVTLKRRAGKSPIMNAEFSLYHVASAEQNADNDFSYTYTEMFENCGAALDDPSLSSKLNVYVREHAVPTAKLITDVRGTVVFTDLPIGMYLVKQTNIVDGYAPCTPFLVKIPNRSGGSYEYDVTATPKTDIARLTDITIKKVWNVDASAETADHVTLQLLRGSVVVETAELNAANNWQITYTGMPESDEYSILEVNIPEGFIATYSQNGYEFTVINSAALIQPEQPSRPQDVLAQTGQLVWPIPVLALTGLFLIALGIIMLRKSRNSNG